MNTTKNDTVKPSILYVTHDYMTFTKDQIEALSYNFKNVHVIVRYNKYTDLKGMVPISKLKKRGKESIIDLSNKPSNITVISSPVSYVSSDSSYLKAGDKHFKIVEKIIEDNEIKFDVIHAHYTWTAGYVAMKLNNKYHVPYIITAHGYDVYDLPFRNEKLLESIKQVLSNCKRVITVSKNNQTILTEKLQIPSNKISIIPNGYNEKHFYPTDPATTREKLKLPHDKRIVLAIGNSQYLQTKEGVVEVKGHKYFYYAAKSIINNGLMKDVLFGIIGEVPEKEINIEDSMTKYFKLFGKVPHNEIPEWLNACDIFVIPSLYEGVPTVLFEALGCGKPVVGSDAGGIPDIITNKKLGSLVPSANTEALAQAIIRANEIDWNSDYILEYAKQYSWSKIAKDIHSIYKEII